MRLKHLALLLAFTLAEAHVFRDPTGAIANKGNGDGWLASARAEDNSILPRVLLIGDSISIGYTHPVWERLRGKADVRRIPANGGPTTRGLASLEEWLGQEKWDVIHFNWGLHDLEIMPDGTHQVPVEDYEKNLRQLVTRLKETGAVLIWASTTPVPEGNLSPPRRAGDEVKYNAVARKIMQENHILIDDLYTYALPRLKEIQRPANVHFTPEGSQVLADQVAASIEAVLGASSYLRVVRRYADAMIEHGRDVYGKIHSPLFAATLDRKSLRLPTEPPPAVEGIREGDRTLTGANPMHDLNFYQVLYGLSKATDGGRYSAAADEALRWFFEHCQSPATGLFAWGEHLGWDFYTEGPLPGRDIHEFYRPWVLWDKSFELAPGPCHEFALGLWRHQIADRRTGNFSRHAHYSRHGASENHEFPRHGGFYIDTWASAYTRSKSPELLTAIEVLVDSFERRRNPKTGAIPSQSSMPEQLWPTSNLSLAIDLWQSAKKVPRDLAEKMRACASRTDKVLLRTQQDPGPGGNGFYTFASSSLLMPWNARRGHELYSHLWRTGYGQSTSVQVAMLCLIRYHQAGVEEYRDLFMKTADHYLKSEPDKSITLYPGAVGEAMAVMLAAFRLTGEEKYLRRAELFADTAIEIFFDESPLPRASSKHDHHEVITRADTLAMELLDLWAIKTRPGLDLGFVWSER